MTKANRDSVIFFSVAAFVAIAAFTTWASQTEDRIIQYERNETFALDAALREGWRIKYTEVTKRKYYSVEIPVTIVTLERSNWSELWND